MLFHRPISEILAERKSIRTYEARSMAESDRKSIESFIASIGAGPFGTSPRFGIVAAVENDNQALRGLGTYGFIRGARGFVVGAVREAPKDLEDYGYLLEKIVLFATDLGLGTCWLGATFTKSGFASKIGLRPDESIPAILAIGYKKARPDLIDAFLGKTERPLLRKGWELLFFEERFFRPLSKDAAGPYTDAVEAVRVAPSGMNLQPWRIVKEKDSFTFHFFVERTAAYKKPNIFGIADIQRIDLGIALCHFDLTAQELGLKGSWIIDPRQGANLPPLTEYIATWKP